MSKVQYGFFLKGFNCYPVGLISAKRFTTIMREVKVVIEISFAKYSLRLLLLFIFNEVHAIPRTRATQNRGLLNEV